MSHTFTPSDIALVRETSDSLRRQLAAIDSNAHDLERDSLIDQLKGFLAPQPGRTVRNIAHELADDEIEKVVAQFLAATPQFYNTADAAQRAAETCDAVTELHRRRRLLDESPSLEAATLLESILAQAISERPQDFQPDHSAGGTAPTGPTKGTPSPKETA